MWIYLLKRWRQTVKAAAELRDFASLPPTRELAANIARVGISGNQQSGFKYRFFSYDFYQFGKFHTDKIPQMAS